METACSQGHVLQAIAGFLQQTAIKSFLCASHATYPEDAATREKVQAAAYEFRLLLLMQGEQSSRTMRLHELRAELGERRWRLRSEEVPDEIELLAGDGYTIYGLGSSVNTWRLDIRDDDDWRWERLPERPPQHAPEAAVIDGTLLVLGGHDAHPRLHGAGMVTSKVSAYLPQGNYWTSLPALPSARGSGFACAVQGSEVYVAGGIGDLGILRSADVFDLHTRAWRSLPSMSKPRFACAGAVAAGCFHAIGGQFEADSESFVLNRREPSWKSMAGVPFKDMWIKGVATEDCLFAFGRTKVAQLDLSTLAWTNLPSAPGHRIVAMCSALVRPATAHLCTHPSSSAAPPSFI